MTSSANLKEFPKSDFSTLKKNRKQEALFLTVDEIGYLLDFIGKDTIFGVRQQEESISTLPSLIEKKVLNKSGEVYEATVAIVECLRMYAEAEYYLRFQNYIFAILKDGKCILTQFKKQGEEFVYMFNLGININIFEIILTHPIIARSIETSDNPFLTEEIKQIVTPFVNRNITANIIGEFFDNKEELIDSIILQQQEGKLYQLNEKFDLEHEVPFNGVAQWFLEKLQITKEQLETIETVLLEMLEGSDT